MSVEIIQGDCLTELPKLAAESVHCCVTSPPYWGLRDYGHESQFGLEATPELFVEKLVAILYRVRRVLRDDGTVWLNLGDTYFGGGRGGNPEESEFRKQATNAGSLVERTKLPAGCKAKDLVGIPWRVALALQADGWYLRQDIIWHKPNPMPESVTDRCTKAHEYIFLLSKSERYYFNQAAILEPIAASSVERLSQPNLEYQNGSDRVPGKTNGNMKAVSRKPRASGMQHKQIAVGNNQGGYLGSNDEFESRNKRSVWTVNTKPYKAAHFATFPPDLIKPCILAGCPEGGTVLDPFLGSGTTALVAQNNGCNCIGIELNPEYVKLAKRRVQQRSLLA